MNGVDSRGRCCLAFVMFVTSDLCLQVDDVTNQKKALAEYKEVYQAANVCYHHGYMRAADSAHSAK